MRKYIYCEEKNDKGTVRTYICASGFLVGNSNSVDIFADKSVIFDKSEEKPLTKSKKPVLSKSVFEK